jgi:hypothetical protein
MMERIAMNPSSIPCQGIIARYVGILNNDSSRVAWVLCDSAFSARGLGFLKHENTR